MDKSKVFFTNMRTFDRESLLDKFKRLIVKSGFDTIDFTNKFVAIKLNFGEEGNLAYLRHNYAKVLVDMIKERGGKPFLTDCNTLYVGYRTNALDHLDCAYNHGYNPLSAGCHVIIADGLKGTDDIEVPVDGEYVKSAKIGRAVMDADVFISLTHFKAHENAGIGGALKNIGMGCGSRAGKMEMHYSGKPRVDSDLCIGCKGCVKICGQSAIDFIDKKSVISEDRCVGCGRCIGVCPVHAISPTNSNSNELLNCRMAEYAKAVVQNRPCFHINLAIDISPFCDCHSTNDIPIIPDVGMFASFDPVAIDHASTTACNTMPPHANSLLSEHAHDYEDHFKAIAPTSDWYGCLEHAQKIGVGTMDYDLITVK
ncbi:MAG: DUF362 domain-containing protein [Oscillospiraceae bacterium]